ncbi:MAG TPA: methylated-DNA--[protein]-cysteine S-methyltransferase [Solirubrobacteraceae bacterium]|nr:methylated-DNA--[protein]-cysteine S-methyltransferase [Solirubrobacteraceae bacterium]
MPAELLRASLAWTAVESPLGPLTLLGGDDGLRAMYFPGRSGSLDEAARDPRPFDDAVTQLEEYFAGERRVFDLPLVLEGTAFQRRVWDVLRTIEYGQTRSYGELAAEIGRLDRVRAVGAAVGHTPVPIIVPCHRVIGADGSLTGYGGGLRRKQALLELESRVHGGAAPHAVWAGRQLSLLAQRPETLRRIRGGPS